MATIDERIVKMRFDNNQFKSGITDTLSLLGKFKGAFNLGSSKQSVDDLQGSVSRFNLNPMTAGISAAQSSFSALGSMAFGVFASIGAKAASTGMEIANNLTMKPVMEGFQEYELKMGSIQTILANTQRHGTTLDDVTASLENLNDYADKTIYNFGDMTRNIGLFTNAGLELEESTSMIKGFSNAAAASGSNAQQAAGAAYQLSQGLSAGYLTAQDWISLTTAGMGNKNMQTDLIAIADAMGTFSEGNQTAQTATEDFKKSLAEGKWLTKDVMSKYLQTMAGDMDEAALKALGLNDEVIKTLQTNAKIGEESATKVRSLTQLMGGLQEVVGSSWAVTWELLFGDFEAATVLFTNISETIGPIIENFGNFRNAALEVWQSLGGRDAIIQGLGNAFRFLGELIKPAADAFREIFKLGSKPFMAGFKLNEISQGFKTFTESLKVSGEMASRIKDTFKGVFSIFSIAGQIIGAVAKVLFGLAGSSGGAVEGFLGITAAIGRFITKVDEALKNGTLLSQIVDFLSVSIDTLAGLFGAVTGGITEFLAGGEGSVGLFQRIGQAAGKAGEFISSFVDRIKDLLRNGMEKIAGLDWGAIMGAAISAGIGGLFLRLGKLIKDGFDVNIGGSIFEAAESLIKTAEGSFDSLSGIFDGLTSTLETMQNSLRADILVKIAIAVGIMALSLTMLAGIPAGDLAKATAAIAGLAAQLVGAMYVMSLIKPTDVVALQSLGSAMVLLATAVLILSHAVQNLGQLDLMSLAKGLGGVAAAMGIMVGAVKLLPDEKKILSSSAGMILMAVSMKVLASAVKDFAEIDIESMFKGLGGIAVALVILAGAVALMPEGGQMAATGAGLILVGAALKIIASVVEDLGSMSVETLGKGLITVGIALSMIAGAMHLMPKDMLVTAAALNLVAAALVVISGVIAMLGGLSLDQVLIGLIGIGGAMSILAVGLNAMQGSIAGAGALALAAFGLSMLAPALVMLSKLDVKGVATALGTLAGVFVVLGLGAIVLTPLLPIILGLAGALTLIGITVVAAGVGLTMLAGALVLLAGPASAGVDALAKLFNLIPQLLVKIAEGIVMFLASMAEQSLVLFEAMTTLITGVMDSILTAIINVAPKMGEAFVTVISTLLQAIITLTPQIVQAVVTLLMAVLQGMETVVPQFIQTFTVILMSFLQAVKTVGPMVISTMMTLILALVETVVDAVPQFVDAAMRLIIGFLDGVAAKIGDVVAAAVNLILSFAEGISSQIPVVVDRGFQMVIQLLNGIADAIRNNSEQVGAAAADLGLAIIQGIAGAIRGGVSVVVNAAKEMASNALSSAKAVLGIKSPSREFKKIGDYIAQGLAIGIDKNANKPVKASEKMAGLIVSKTDKAFSHIDDVADNKVPKLTDSYSKMSESIQGDSVETGRAINDSLNKPLEYAMVAGEKGSKLNLKEWAGVLKETIGMFTALKGAMDMVYAPDEDNSEEAAIAREEKRLQLENEILSLEDRRISIAKKQAELYEKRDKGEITPEELAREERRLQLERESLELSERKYKLSVAAFEKENGAKQGGNLMDGIRNGIAGGWPGITDMMNRGAGDLINNFKRMFGIHSPSRVMAAMGSYIVDGLAEGLGNNSAASQSMSALFGVLSTDVDAGMRIVSNALNSGFGPEPFGDILGNGAKQKMKDFSSVMSDELGGAQTRMRALKTEFDNVFDGNPVIAPVIDLTDFRRGMAEIDRMTSSGLGQARISASGAMDRFNGSLRGVEGIFNNPGKAVTFNQNNYSPKSLTVDEIYRKTNNQLDFLKGAFKP